jgi:hypothetical protein
MSLSKERSFHWIVPAPDGAAGRVRVVAMRPETGGEVAMSLLRNRRVGLLVTLNVWAVTTVLAVHALREDTVRDRRNACLANLKRLAGAIEMYQLDKNLKPWDQALRDMDPVALQQLLAGEGYLQSATPCPSGQWPGVRWHTGGCEPRCTPGEVDPMCPEQHASLSALARQREQDPRETPEWAAGSLVLRLAAFAIFPLAFYVAVLIRSARWGERYRAGRVDLLPASWVLVLTLVFAPAGLVAIARYRQAVWQFLFIAGATVGLAWPSYLTLLPVLAWTAVTRYMEERGSV